MTSPCVRCGAPTDAYICRTEANDLATQLRAAAGHAEDAWTVIARQTRTTTAGAGRQPDPIPTASEDNRRNRVKDFAWQASIEKPPVGALRPEPTPADLGALDRYHTAENTAITWLRDLGGDAEDLPGALHWLANHTEALRLDPAAKEAFDDLEAACRQLERLVDRRVDNRHFIGICDCGKALYAPWNWTAIQCKPCGAIWNLADGQDILLRHLDDRLVTLGEAAKLAGHLDPDRSQDAVRKLVEKWAGHGRLVPHGHIMREPTDREIRHDPEAYPVPVPTYRFGEIRKLLDETPRRERRAA